MVTAYDRPGATGKQLDMQETIAQLEEALATAKALAASAGSAKAEPADTDAQQQMKDDLDGLKKPGLLMSTPASAALVAGQCIHLAAQDNINAVAGKNADWSVLKRFAVAAGEKISLFARSGLKIFAGKGPVDVQAQNGPMSLAADKDISLASINGKVKIAAAKELILECGGAFIQFKDGSITLGGPYDLFFKTITIQKKGKESMHLPLPAMPVPQSSGPYSLRFDLSGVSADGEIPEDASYLIKVGQSTRYFGTLDEDGMTGRVFTEKAEKVQVSVRNGDWSHRMDSVNDDLFADGTHEDE